jgi:exosortase
VVVWPCSCTIGRSVSNLIADGEKTGPRVFGGHVPPTGSSFLKFALIAALVGGLYAWTLGDMAYAWWIYPNLSQGMLIPPLALYFAWQTRSSVLALPERPDWRGSVLLLASCVLFLIGNLAAEYFLPRMSFVLLLMALTWMFWGVARLRALAFPFMLLATMVPLPALLYNWLATPLQLLASELSTRLAQMGGVSIYQDGNVIHLATISLGVEEACSGLNSLSALIVASLLLGEVYSSSGVTRTILLLLATPIAIAANILRVTGTAVLADWRPEVASGFYHSFSGWLVFLAGYAMLYLASQGIRRIFDRGHGKVA